MKTSSIHGFIYEHTVNEIMHPCQHIFDFYSDTDKTKLGTLVCHKSEIQIRPNYENSVLAIDFLEVSDKDKGLGTKILKFAQNYSEQVGCKGFLTVKADGSFMPQRIPHIFYRKFGFSTLDKKTDKNLDRFIKSKQNATSKDFPCLLMHYPPAPKNFSYLKKLYLLLCQFIKMRK